jgi:hypothetical protein
MTSLSYDPDSRVDEYIDALPDWQQAVCSAGSGGWVSSRSSFFVLLLAVDAHDEVGLAPPGGVEPPAVFDN